VLITNPVSRDTPQHNKQQQYTPVRKTKTGLDATPQIKKKSISNEKLDTLLPRGMDRSTFKDNGE
jgi:hypothetical protein